MSIEKTMEATSQTSNHSEADSLEQEHETSSETSDQSKKPPPILLRGMIGGKKRAQEKVRSPVHLALLIDVDEFESDSGLPSLPGSHADATLLREILCTEANGYVPWAEGSFNGCHAKSPTYRRLRTKIEEFVKQSQNYEIASIFVYISTHGFIESDGLHFCMADTQFQQGRILKSLRFQDLKRWLSPLGKYPFVMMIDSCRSSNENNNPETKSDLKKPIVPKRDDVALNGFKNWAVLTAAEHGQSAHEIKDPSSSEFFQYFQQKHQISLKEQHGIFTLTFLDVLLEEKFKETGIYQVIMETNHRMKPICEHYQIEQTARCYLEAGLNIEVMSPRTLKVRVPTMEELHQASHSPTPNPRNEKYPPSYTPPFPLPAVSSSSVRGFASSNPSPSYDLEYHDSNVPGTIDTYTSGSWLMENSGGLLTPPSNTSENVEVRNELDLPQTETESVDSLPPETSNEVYSGVAEKLTLSNLETISPQIPKHVTTSLDTFIENTDKTNQSAFSHLSSEVRKAAIAALGKDWPEDIKEPVVSPTKKEETTGKKSPVQRQSSDTASVGEETQLNKEKDTIKEASISEKLVENWLRKRADIEGFKSFFSLRIYGLFWFWKFLKDKHLWGLSNWGISSHLVWLLLPCIGLFGRPIFFEILTSNIPSENDDLESPKSMNSIIVNLDIVRFVSRMSTVMDVVFVVYAWEIFWRWIGKRTIETGELFAIGLLFLGSVLCFSFLVSYFQGQYNAFLKVHWEK